MFCACFVVKVKLRKIEIVVLMDLSHIPVLCLIYNFFISYGKILPTAVGVKSLIVQFTWTKLIN